MFGDCVDVVDDGYGYWCDCIGVDVLDDVEYD